MRYRGSETDSWLHRGTQNHKENPCTSSKAFPQDHETICRNKFWMSSFLNDSVYILVQNSLPLTRIKVPVMRPRFTCPQGHFQQQMRHKNTLCWVMKSTAQRTQGHPHPDTNQKVNSDRRGKILLLKSCHGRFNKRQYFIPKQISQSNHCHSEF